MMIFKDNSSAQIISQLLLQQMYFSFYTAYRCHRSREQFRHHVTNEILIVLVIYCSVTWTEVVEDIVQRYNNGFIFPVIVIIMLIYNIFKMTIAVYVSRKVKDKTKKKYLGLTAEDLIKRVEVMKDKIEDDGSSEESEES